MYFSRGYRLLVRRTPSQNSFSAILSNVYSLQTNHIIVYPSPTANEIVYTYNNSGLLLLGATTTIYLTHLLLRTQAGVPSVASFCRLCRIG